MNAFLSAIPIIAIRFGLLGIRNKEALKRAAFFPPLIGREKIASGVYQISEILILLYLFFLRIKTDFPYFHIGLAVYFLGITVCILSVLDYAKPEKTGINLNGLYRISRNPMYIGYFIYFLGCELLTHSFVLLGLLAAFQVSAHWIILSEERWCIEKFGERYIRYMKKVRRYL